MEPEKFMTGATTAAPADDDEDAADEDLAAEDEDEPAAEDETAALEEAAPDEEAVLLPATLELPTRERDEAAEEAEEDIFLYILNDRNDE